MTDNAPRKPGTLSITKPEPDPPPLQGGKMEIAFTPEEITPPEPTETLIPVKIIRGYWPASWPEGFVIDPLRPKIPKDVLCMLPENEAQEAADKGLLTILTPKGYRDAKEAEATVPSTTWQARTIPIART